MMKDKGLLLVWLLAGTGVCLTAAAPGAGASSPSAVTVLLAKQKGGGKAGKKDKEKAAQLHQMALNLYKKGMYAEAVEYFNKAYAIDEDPSTIFNIAKCYDQLYKYKEAHAYYEDYIATGDEQRLAEAKEAIERIESMAVMLKVVTDPEGATVFIDGEEVKFQKTPVIAEVSAGKHAVVVELEGHARVERTVDIPYGGEEKVDVVLEKVSEKSKVIVVEDVGAKGKKKGSEVVLEKKKEKPPRKAFKPRVSFGIGLAVGATVSTARQMGSFIDGTLQLDALIGRATLGVGVDNLFFMDSYLLAAYPAAGYTLKVWKDLSLHFSAGFGAAYFHAFKDAGDEDGHLVFEKGGYWDLVAHADVRLRYKAGPILIQVIPVCADVLIGVGSLDPPPLAQFLFLAGIAYEM
jgi:hypothetical protein